MKNWYCYVSNIWFASVVASDKSPLVRIMDFLWGSTCKYCMAVRVGIAGFGVAAAIFGGVPATILGGFLVALSVALTIGERYWLCGTEIK